MASMKRKTPPVKVARPITKKSAKVTIKPRVSEANASVSTVSRGATVWNTDVVEISSDSDKGEDQNENEEDEDWNQDHGASEEKNDGSERQTQISGQATRNITTTANGSHDSEVDEVSDEEPTFGDLVRDQGTVDVPAMLGLIQEASVRDIVPGPKASSDGTETKRSPNLASLSNLLNAALRNNDDANLEVCFGTTSNTTWVRNTIQRMDPALAGPLLQKLAARMYRRPGRAQTLIGWVQWTLITHGGALASQPGVTQSLQELHRVLEERARGLNSLLLLKGKLDMLDAQMQLRRSQRSSAKNSIGHDERNDHLERFSGARNGFMKEDTVALYIEAKEEAAAAAGQILVAGTAEGATIAGSGNGEDDEDQGVGEIDEEEESNEDDDDEGDEEDDAIEEMDDSGIAEENEVDFDDVDEEDDLDEEEEDSTSRDAISPAKLYNKSAGAFSVRR